MAGEHTGPVITFADFVVQVPTRVGSIAAEAVEARRAVAPSNEVNEGGAMAMACCGSGSGGGGGEKTWTLFSRRCLLAYAVRDDEQRRFLGERRVKRPFELGGTDAGSWAVRCLSHLKTRKPVVPEIGTLLRLPCRGMGR